MGQLLVVFIPFIAVMTTFMLLIEGNLYRQGYRRRRTPQSGIVHHTFDPGASTSFRGGSRVGRWNASIPQAELQVDQTRLRQQLLASLDRTISRHRRAKIRGTLGNGIRFETTDGRYDGVIFWTWKTTDVLAGLEQLGWPMGL